MRGEPHVQVLLRSPSRILHTFYWWGNTQPRTYAWVLSRGIFRQTKLLLLMMLNVWAKNNYANLLFNQNCPNLSGTNGQELWDTVSVCLVLANKIVQMRTVCFVSGMLIIPNKFGMMSMICFRNSGTWMGAMVRGGMAISGLISR